MADCWHLKNANSGTPRPAMMTVQDQSSLSRVKLGISSNPAELNKGYGCVHAFHFQRIYTCSGLKGPDSNHHFVGHRGKPVIIVRKQFTPVSSDFYKC